jgi:hypothetical protein
VLEGFSLVLLLKYAQSGSVASGTDPGGSEERQKVSSIVFLSPEDKESINQALRFLNVCGLRSILVGTFPEGDEPKFQLQRIKWLKSLNL